MRLDGSSAPPTTLGPTARAPAAPIGAHDLLGRVTAAGRLLVGRLPVLVAELVVAVGQAGALHRTSFGLQSILRFLFYIVNIDKKKKIRHTMANSKYKRMTFDGVNEKTILIVKPDGVQRGLIGEIVRRLENKGLKICGLKMQYLSEEKLRDHYAHHVEKPFYPGLEAFMKSSPVVIICAEGRNAVSAVRLIAGVTDGAAADAGTMRGDFALGFANVVHCSDSLETAKAEVERFFDADEVFQYDKTDWLHVYMEDERA